MKILNKLTPEILEEKSTGYTIEQGAGPIIDKNMINTYNYAEFLPHVALVIKILKYHISNYNESIS